MLGLLLMVIATACGTPPSTPVAQANPSPTATQRTPLPTPSTRTAPTLPPEYTTTPMPTPSDTPMPSDTPTATHTPDVETICAKITWAGDYLRDKEFADDFSYLFSVTIGWPDAVGDLSWRDIETGENDHILIPAGTDLLFDLADIFEPGTHELSLKVITNAYPAICQDSVQFTILPLVTDTPVPTETPTATVTPEVTITPILTAAATPEEVTIESLVIEILILIRDRLREDD